MLVCAAILDGLRLGAAPFVADVEVVVDAMRGLRRAVVGVVEEGGFLGVEDILATVSPCCGVAVPRQCCIEMLVYALRMQLVNVHAQGKAARMRMQGRDLNPDWLLVA